MKKKLILTLFVLSIVLAGLHILLFWGGSGNVIDIIQGNMSPSIELKDREVSFTH